MQETLLLFYFVGKRAFKYLGYRSETEEFDGILRHEITDRRRPI